MDEKKKEILEKTLEIFHSFGIRSVSMDDVAKELRISKKTLYQFVENKSDLVEQTFRYQSSKNNDFMENVSNSNRNAIDVLLEISKWMHDEISRITPQLSFDLNKYYPEMFQKLFNEKRQHIYEKIKANIEQGIQEGLFRTDLNVELISSLYMKKIEDLHEPDGLICNHDFSFKTIFNVMFDNHIRGIANEKGIAYYEENKKNLKLNEKI
ncbi:MAG TPA: TetR/AcrR family transcriptional regulator [Bacteroidales bacterium]|nr:TetR/AcrR family transcriptional regulator [Bacteroidales bacterium]